MSAGDIDKDRWVPVCVQALACYPRGGRQPDLAIRESEPLDRFKQP